MTCPLSEHLPVYLDEYRQEIDAHLEKCSNCREYLSLHARFESVKDKFLFARSEVTTHPPLEDLRSYPDDLVESKRGSIRQHLSNCYVCASIVASHTKLRRARSDVSDFHELLKQADKWLKSLDTTTTQVRNAKRDAGNSRTSELVPEAVTTGMLLAGASEDAGDAGAHVRLELTPEVEWASEPITDQPLHLQVEIQKGEPERVVVTGITPELGAPLFLAAVVLRPGGQVPTESDKKAWRESRVAVERPEGATQLVVWVAIGKELVARLKAKLPE